MTLGVGVLDQRHRHRPETCHTLRFASPVAPELEPGGLGGSQAARWSEALFPQPHSPSHGDFPDVFFTEKANCVTGMRLIPREPTWSGAVWSRLPRTLHTRNHVSSGRWQHFSNAIRKLPAPIASINWIKCAFESLPPTSGVSPCDSSSTAARAVCRSQGTSWTL